MSDNENWKAQLLQILKGKAAKKAGFFLLALFALRLGVNWISTLRGSERVPSVKVSFLSFKSIDKTLTLPGNIEAIEQATLYAHVSGYLKKILVDEGDAVKKNQLLAIIDAPDVIQEYRNAKAEYDFKATTLKRYEELLKENVVSRQEYDKVEAEANQSRARFDNAASNQDYTSVRAPFAGAIARRLQYPGDFISAPTKGGSPTPLFMLVNEAKLRVAVNIPQKEIGNIVIGHNVDIVVDTFPGKKFSGVVSRVDALLDEASKTQRVIVDVDNVSANFRAGMFASVIVHIVRKEGVPMIQTDALLSEGEKSSLYLVKDGKVKKLTVEVGDSDGGFSEIRSPKIDSTTQIIVNGQQGLVNDEAVDVAEVIPIASDSVSKGKDFSYGSLCTQNSVHDFGRSPDNARDRGIFDVENATRYPSDIQASCSDGGDDLYGHAR